MAPDDRATAKAKEEKRTQDNREFAFQEQCFLSHNRQQIFDMMSKKPPVSDRQILENDHVISWYADAGKGASSLMSKINATTGAQHFFNLDSSILTQLKPIVELYKVYPDIQWKAGTNSDDALPFKIKLPLGEQIKFDPEKSSVDNPDEATNLSAIEEVIFRPNNVLGNAMLTDLKFAFTGKNVALLNTVEDINFTINFSSANVFFHKFVSKKDPSGTGVSPKDIEYSFMDLISFTTKYIDDSAKTAGFNDDLDGAIRDCNAPTAFKDINAVTVTASGDKHFEIQLIVRYDPEDVDWELARLSGHPIKDDQIGAVKSFLRNSAISMRLQLASHTINYSGNSGAADPSLKINFNFKAYIESAFGSSDLDLFRIADSEAENLRVALEHLAKVRTLLDRIKKDDLTLEKGFEKGGDLRTIYTKARNDVEGAIEDTTWAINHPDDTKGPAATSLRPSRKQRLRMSVERGRASRAGEPFTPEFNDKLFEDKNDPSSEGKGGTEGLLIIFKELEEHLGSLIKYHRRVQISKAYGQFFKNLWAQDRMYQLVLTPAQVQEPGSSQSDMAKKRANQAIRLDKTGSLLILGPRGKKGAKGPAATGETQLLKSAEANEDAQTMWVKIQDGDKEGKFTKPRTSNNKNYNANFTTLGDIIDVAINIATRKKHDKDGATRGKGLYHRRMGIILGPLEKVKNSGGTPLSLADVPISLRMLMGFWVKKVVAKDRQTYMLGDFIKDIISDLILPSLGSRCVDGGGFETDYTLGTTTFTSEMTPNAPFYPRKLAGTDYPEEGASRVKLAGQKFVPLNDATKTLPWFKTRDVAGLTNVSPNTPLEKQFNYMLLYINNFSVQTKNPKDEEENIDDGIYYLKIAKVPSPVLQASFAKEPIKWLREARVAGQLTKTGGLALRDVYRFSCTMYGNNIFKPGMHVFVDPTRDGATYRQWADLGIGGFYLVIGVTHSVLEGNSAHHLTSLTCKWEDFGCAD